MNCIAIDIGAGSGRIVRGRFDSDRIALEEVHRFRNGMRFLDGHYRWGIDSIFNEVLKGLKKASRCKEPPSSIGLDTWGVDFVLLDAEDRLLELPVAYRDSRTDGMMPLFHERLGAETIYKKTGIQFMQLNTLYQLFSMKRSSPGLRKRARRLLMIPDYLNFLLTGKKCMEFTNATTTQLLNAAKRDWDKDILGAIPVDGGLFSKPVEPGTVLGTLSDSVRARTGLGPIPVIAPATHDTGSAVASVPASGKDWAFISSGTWSLMGRELRRPICTKAAMERNFTSEGGVQGTFRFLKNIMGMWLVDGLRRSFPSMLPYGRLESQARKTGPFTCFVDPNSRKFLNPRSMKAAFNAYFRATGQSTPASQGSYFRCALESLALSYRSVIEELGQLRTGPINRIHIIGGGSRNRLLDQMTADATGLPVHAGPVEGTAVGNLLVQAIALGHIRDIGEGRMLVRNSFNIEHYVPGHTNDWDEAWTRFQQLRETADEKARQD